VSGVFHRPSRRSSQGIRVAFYFAPPEAVLVGYAQRMRILVNLPGMTQNAAHDWFGFGCTPFGTLESLLACF
jgi:hypothetical protein